MSRFGIKTFLWLIVTVENAVMVFNNQPTSTVSTFSLKGLSHFYLIKTFTVDTITGDSPFHKKH